MVWSLHTHIITERGGNVLRLVQQIHIGPTGCHRTQGKFPDVNQNSDSEGPQTGDCLETAEFRKIFEICKTGIRQLLGSPYDSGRNSCWNARGLKQALNIEQLVSTTGTNLRSHSIVPQSIGLRIVLIKPITHTHY